MSKATANKAIDFNRLFTVKDQLAGKALDASRAAKSAEKGRGEGGAAHEAPPSASQAPAIEQATVFAFPVDPALAAPSSPPEGLPAALSHVTDLLPPPLDLHPKTAVEQHAGPLRVGLPRPLHERVRAAAAMACVPPTALVRDLLEAAAPHFDGAAALSELARRAREAFPEAGPGRRSIDVRMQVPVNENLHRRLLQVAALRAQTLGACLLDVLEHRLPR